MYHWLVEGREVVKRNLKGFCENTTEVIICDNRVTIYLNYYPLTRNPRLFIHRHQPRSSSIIVPRKIWQRYFWSSERRTPAQSTCLPARAHRQLPGSMFPAQHRIFEYYLSSSMRGISGQQRWSPTTRGISEQECPSSLQRSCRRCDTTSRSLLPKS